MIDQALTFVTKQVNQFLKREMEVDHNLVELSNIPAPHTLAKLHLTVVSLEEEAAMRNQPAMGYGNPGVAKGVAPLYINLHFLISVSPNTPYVEGLKYLSLAMQYFQQNPMVQTQNPELPKGIDKMTFEIYNLNTERQKDLWQSLGTSYQPSVVYKLRVLEIGGE